MKEEDEIYEDYEKQQKSETTKITRKFSTKQIVFFVAFFVIIAYLTLITKAFSIQAGFIIGIGGLALFYFILSKQDAEEEMVTLKQAKAILSDELKYMQHTTNELQQGSIKIGPEAKLRKIEGVPECYVIGFMLETDRYLQKKFMAEIDPFGKLTAMYPAPYGIRVDKPQIKFVLTKEQRWQQQYGKD